MNVMETNKKKKKRTPEEKKTRADEIRISVGVLTPEELQQWKRKK